jgi:predicted small lipoprotein YifL
MITLRAMPASLAVASLLAMSACGLKGPLYLPDDGKEAVVAPPASSRQDPAKQRTSPIPAPQSQKERDRRDRPEEPRPASPGDPGSQDAPAPPDPDRPANSLPPAQPDR